MMIFVVWTALPLFYSGGNASSVCVPASLRHLSPELIKNFTYSDVIQLSKTVVETQADFAQVRLGDRDYDEYLRRIPLLPRPIHQPHKIPEETLLQMEIKDLYTFKEFIKKMKTHEKKKSLFLAKFETIDGKINGLIGHLKDLENCRGYQVTYQGASVQPTLKPTATQKEQDEWELSVMRELWHWLIPVQGELYKQLNHSY
ncbi:unnamed protein product [Porites lobata]|uniref:Uncharacterized protein n=1 Tax=Porites lobata TaxID=104759 RepID=A0ABN8N2M8_9CNID|nr:unnamed protein product [Porites lobata]